MKTFTVSDISPLSDKWNAQKEKQARFIPSVERLDKITADQRESLILRNGTIVDDLQRYLSNLDKCGTKKEFSISPATAEVKITRANSCNHGKTCKLCNNRQALKRGDMIEEARKDIEKSGAKYIYMLTFTMENVSDIYEAIDNFRTAWRKWYLNSEIYSKLAGGLKSIEVKRGAGSGLHHVHAHCLVWSMVEISTVIYHQEKKKQLVEKTQKEFGRDPSKDELRPLAMWTTIDQDFEDFKRKIIKNTELSYYFRRKCREKGIVVPKMVYFRREAERGAVPLSKLTSEWYSASGAVNLEIDRVKGSKDEIKSAIAEVLKYVMKTSEYQKENEWFGESSAALDLMTALDAIRGMRQVDFFKGFRAIKSAAKEAAAVTSDFVRGVVTAKKCGLPIPKFHHGEIDTTKKFFGWTAGPETTTDILGKTIYTPRYEEITERRIGDAVWQKWTNGILGLRARIVGRYNSVRAEVRLHAKSSKNYSAELVQRVRSARLEMDIALCNLRKKVNDSRRRLRWIYGPLDTVLLS